MWRRLIALCVFNRWMRLRLHGLSQWSSGAKVARGSDSNDCALTLRAPITSSSVIFHFSFVLPLCSCVRLFDISLICHFASPFVISCVLTSLFLLPLFSLSSSMLHLSSLSTCFFFFTHWGEKWWEGETSTLCCYHSNCITKMSQWCWADMRTFSLPLFPLAALRLKLTFDKNKEMLWKHSPLFINFQMMQQAVLCDEFLALTSDIKYPLRTQYRHNKATPTAYSYMEIHPAPYWTDNKWAVLFWSRKWMLMQASIASMIIDLPFSLLAINLILFPKRVPHSLRIKFCIQL